jgi:DNA (cytosine-5)-methyltransferase 1
MFAQAAAFNELMHQPSKPLNSTNGRKPNTPSSHQTTPCYLIDLFSGCGGMSQGFKAAGWHHIFAVEKLRAPSQSYAANFHCPVWADDIEGFVAALKKGWITLPKIHAIVGGPPCQGFSRLGKMSAKSEKLAHHIRQNRLWTQFAEIVDLLKPTITLTENVPEFLNSAEFEVFEKRMSVDYKLDTGVLNAAEFGVAQERKRAFCLGSRVGRIRLPKPNGQKATVRDAIGHLSLEPDGMNWHVGRNVRPTSIQRYKVVPAGGNRFDLMRARPDITPNCWLRKPTGTTDVFGRLEWDDTALTIRTEFFKPEKGCYLHPEAHRPITHREAACLQSFPDNFIFIGSPTEVARQIGEAVPPRLAESIANTITEHLKAHGVA